MFDKLRDCDMFCSMLDEDYYTSHGVGVDLTDLGSVLWNKEAKLRGTEQARRRGSVEHQQLAGCRLTAGDARGADQPNSVLGIFHAAHRSREAGQLSRLGRLAVGGVPKFDLAFGCAQL